MNNIEKEQLKRAWDRKRKTAIAIGCGEMVGTLAYGLVHNHIVGTDRCCVTGMVISGMIGVFTAGIALISANPYEGNEIQPVEDGKDEKVEKPEEEAKVYVKTK